MANFYIHFNEDNKPTTIYKDYNMAISARKKDSREEVKCVKGPLFSKKTELYYYIARLYVSKKDMKKKNGVKEGRVWYVSSREQEQSDEKYDLIFDAVSKSSESACQNILTPGGAYIETSGPDPGVDELLFLKELIEEGKLKTVIDRTYSFEDIVEAHRYVDKGHKIGNVIVTFG